MPVDVAELRTALARQWSALFTWLEPWGDDLAGRAGEASALPGWTNGELVAHLGRSMQALTVCVPAPPGTVPLALAEYLGTYPQRAVEITEATRALAARIAAHPLDEVDRLAREAIARVEGLEKEAVPSGAHRLVDPGALVVQARRGPVTLRDMVVSRLIELVVHAHDLIRSLRLPTPSSGQEGLDLGGPLDASAQQIVADELLAIVIVRGGWSLQVAEPALWIDLATGRRPYDVDLLAQAVQANYASDGVPDLGRMLPLL